MDTRLPTCKRVTFLAVVCLSSCSILLVFDVVPVLLLGEMGLYVICKACNFPFNRLSKKSWATEYSLVVDMCTILQGCGKIFHLIHLI